MWFRRGVLLSTVLPALAVLAMGLVACSGDDGKDGTNNGTADAAVIDVAAEVAVDAAEGPWTWLPK